MFDPLKIQRGGKKESIVNKYLKVCLKEHIKAHSKEYFRKNPNKRKLVTDKYTVTKRKGKFHATHVKL